MIVDRRKLSLFKLRITDGVESYDALGDLVQTSSGLSGCEGVRDLLLADHDSLVFQADALGISPLEFVKRRLESYPYMLVTLYMLPPEGA